MIDVTPTTGVYSLKNQAGIPLKQKFPHSRLKLYLRPNDTLPIKKRKTEKTTEEQALLVEKDTNVYVNGDHFDHLSMEEGEGDAPKAPFCRV